MGGSGDKGGSSCSHHEVFGAKEHVYSRGSHWDAPRYGIWGQMRMLRQMLGCQARYVAPHWGTSRGQQAPCQHSAMGWELPRTPHHIRQHHGLNQQQLISSHLAEKEAL